MDQCNNFDREIEIKNQQMAAAAFFFLKTDQYIANERSKMKKTQQSTKFVYNFHKIISSSIPSLPPCLQKNPGTKSTSGAHRKESDKIQVFVQLIPCAESSSCISIDRANNSITVTDPTPSRKFTASSAPKSFPVDSVINEDWPLIEICSSTLNNVIRSVANGEDACVLSFGNVSSGDQNPMLGSDKSASKLGIIPCAILWLFNYINIIRQHENSRFSVRISVTEVSEKQEVCRDLLAKVTNTSVVDGPVIGCFSPTSAPVELRAVDAEKAVYYFDYALSERSKTESIGLSHMLLTLHLYQYHMQNDSGISGGRSRLHLIDLGHGRLSESTDSNALSIQGISKVIMALWSGQRHIPNSESHLTQLLRRALMTSNGRMQTSMLFNISGKEVQYNEALQIVQLASKIYRQKIKSSKLSSTLLSDDNSSSDSFSFRRLTKTRDRGEEGKKCDKGSFSSDVDATSSSEVSCDTVIYRGHRSDSPLAADRGSADGSSQDQTKNAQTELEEKKPDTKLTLFQQKRKGSVRTNSNAWPKIAVKKALQVMKSGQELWVDGPQAMYTDTTTSDNCDSKEPNLGLEPSQHNIIGEDSLDKDNPDGIGKRIKNASKNIEKGQLSEMPLKRYEYQVKTKHGTEKYGSESVLKSMMVTDWLSKQPEISEEVDIDILYAKISSRNNITNKLEIDNSGNINKNNQKLQRDIIESNERKMSSKKHSQIEEWIKSVSVDNPKLGSSPRDVDVVMTQSMYSPTCSPYHTSQNYVTSFSPIPFSPPSAPLSYNANSYDCAGLTKGLPIHPASIGTEIENECSRLWFINNQSSNDQYLFPTIDPFDDGQNNRSASFSSAMPKPIQRIEPVRRSCHKNPTNNPLNYELQRMQHETKLLQGASNKCSIQKYSTLPLDLYSPKHSKDNPKPIAPENIDISNAQKICDITLKPAVDTKRVHKDLKKKETKKVFSFFNQLIRNKKPKKEVTKKEEATNKADTSVNDTLSQTISKQTDVHGSESVDYVRRAGPPLVLSSPYHMVTSPKPFNTRADSSGHGSDCSSFNGIKTAQVSVNFHPETTSFRFAAVHRAGSSGYESVVRDSELSSHNDSASDCSATRNIPLQSPGSGGHKHIVTVSTAAVNTPSTGSTLSQSVSNTDRDKQDYLYYTQESQKVSELILKEKFNILKLEREEVINDLISTMKFYNIDPETSRKDLEKNVCDLDGGDQSTESLKSTNQMLRSVLNRYQSNICVVTSFLSKPESEYVCE